MKYKIINRFPLLSLSDNLKEWSGFITTKPRAILIALSVPNFPSAKGITIKKEDMTVKGTQFWTPKVEELSIKSKASSFLEFLEILEEYAVSNAPIDERSEKDITSRLANINLYSTVIDEIELIGIKNVVHLSTDFKELIIKHKDRSKREHTLKIIIPPKYPDESPTVSTELPFPENFIKWPNHIKRINEMFRSYLNECNSFWDEMEKLDSYVKVLDPLQPNTSHYHRKLMLESNVILHLTFNPLLPHQIPHISFAGPKKLVEEYTTRLDKQCLLWSSQNSVIQNLQSILECVFITAVGYEFEIQEDESKPCPICYAFDLEMEVPDVPCICGVTYHGRCVNDLYLSDIKPRQETRKTVKCLECQLDVVVPSSHCHQVVRGDAAW